MALYINLRTKPWILISGNCSTCNLESSHRYSLFITARAENKIRDVKRLYLFHTFHILRDCSSFFFMALKGLHLTLLDLLLEKCVKQFTADQ
jgi:hypothetical protein